jgi:hypothetical protein
MSSVNISTPIVEYASVNDPGIRDSSELTELITLPNMIIIDYPDLLTPLNNGPEVISQLTTVYKNSTNLKTNITNRFKH